MSHTKGEAAGPRRTVHLAGWLVGLEERLLAQVLALDVAGLTEGQVLSAGPPPYRRIDCDGRALAYVRARPRKRGIRVDISGLWQPPRAARIRIPSATCAASLLIRNEADVVDAVRFIESTIRRTRKREAAAG